MKELNELHRKQNNINRIFNIYLVIGGIILSIIAFIFPKHIILTLWLMITTLIQCYFIFHNKGRIIGAFSIHNHGLYAIINYINSLFMSLTYSIYGAFLGLILYLNNSNEQKTISKSKIYLQTISTFIIGLIVFLIFNRHNHFNYKMIFDMIIFSGNVAAGVLAVQQNKYMFAVFIPTGIIQIIFGFMINEPVIIINSFIYLFSDILSIVKWNIVEKINMHEEYMLKENKR